jgi:hybrid cluster-associated redox disulfide protein
MEHPKLEAGLTVAEVLARWPQTIPIFIRHRMACVGCAMAPFETLAEVAVIYKLDLDCFLNELRQEVALQPSPAGSGENFRPITTEAGDE